VVFWQVNRVATLPLSRRLSVLLASGSTGGTIAAVRNLGANGINVGVISSQPLSAAAWSRWASRSYSAPPETKGRRFVERLLAIGAKDPGQILLPTSDETAWLYTVNADVLKRHFRVYQPSFATINRILDKKLLAAAASKAGLAVLPSWDPHSIGDLEALAPTLSYPILIKPRTHVHRLRNDKGMVVHSPRELVSQYQRFVERERTARAADSPFLRGENLPILQPFVSVGGEGVLSVTGFIDRTGEYFVTRHSTKVFQRSRPVGVGVCFESLPDTNVLADTVRRLCRELDYFGLFELEFLWFGGSWVAIDFNPRLFNQVGMDIHRGMPLPLLACLDAADERTALRVVVAMAQAESENIKTVFCDRFTLRAILFLQTLTARISRQDHSYWRFWMKKNAAHAVDAAVDDTDPVPGVIHALSEVYLGLKALPRFLRSTPRSAPPLIAGDFSKIPS
jgi:D-aspartate ligase